MRFDVITLFPELFVPHLTHGVTRRAFSAASENLAPSLQVELWQLRDFALDNYRRVDDRPYGGGPGMVMLAQPIERALAAVRVARDGADVGSRAPVIHFSPTGRRLDQALVREFAAGSGAILLCGRYEGIDQRVIERHVDLEVSLGDFVLSGGELAALALLDAVARLGHGVLGDAQSHQQDSFSDGLLDCPHYSRPVHLPPLQVGSACGAMTSQGAKERAGQVGSHEEQEPAANIPKVSNCVMPSGLSSAPDSVPDVLMSGNHAAIARWRRQQSLQRTASLRPDLLHAARLAGRLSVEDERYLKSLGLGQ
jgi:tRNA (guanine37-N1)-methyltransferase